MKQKRNAVATPFLTKAYKLHKMIYRNVYPYPVDITIKQHTISIKINPIFRFKYILFFFTLIVVSFGIGIGCCVFLPVYKLFWPSSIETGSLPILVCICSGSAYILEFFSYLAYCKSREVETLFNQLFAFERKCNNVFHKIQNSKQ